MKRKTLLALGIAGALACGTASAATFLCMQDEPGGSTVSCAEIPAEVLGSITSGEDTSMLSSPSVTYYLVPLDQEEVALLSQPSDSASSSDNDSSAAAASGDTSSADQWQYSEPQSSIYNSSPEFDAMNPSGQ